MADRASGSTSQQLALPLPFRERSPIDPPEAPALSTTIRTLPPLLDVILLDHPPGTLPDHLAASANSLLAFERDCIVPSVKELELRMTPQENVSREAAFTSTWVAESKAYLYDSITIHNYLSRVASTRYMVTPQPEFREAASQFRRQGVAAFKEYLTTTDPADIDIRRLYRALLILLWADSALGDRQAFQQHAMVMKEISASHHDVLSGDPSFNLHHFVSVVYFEVQHAVMTLTPPSLDLGYNGWVERQFLPLWTQASPAFRGSRLDADRNLDPQLEGDIRILYLDSQEVIDTIHLIRRHPFLNTSASWLYAISKTVFAIGRLIDIFLQIDIEDALRRIADFGMLAIRRLEVAAAALCAVYWLRELAGIENLRMADTMRLFTWNPIMMSKLRVIFEACYSAWLQSLQLVDSVGPPRLSIWLLWTAAMAENSTLPPTNITEERDQNWFTRHFMDLCQRANLQSMVQCQEVVNRFLQLYDMRPSSDNGWYARYFAPKLLNL